MWQLIAHMKKMAPTPPLRVHSNAFCSAPSALVPERKPHQTYYKSPAVPFSYICTGMRYDDAVLHNDNLCLTPSYHLRCFISSRDL